MDNFVALRSEWLGKASSNSGVWPAMGVAILGEFSGIQKFVLRPVPGAAGAARRLRARSFRVLALTRLVAAAVEKRFSSASARLFYSAGGRFLVVMNSSVDWRDRLEILQREIDIDLVNQFHGELAFHLAGAQFEDGRIPTTDLVHSMASRKVNPLAGCLIGAKGWNTGSFSRASIVNGKCEGCASTDFLKNDGGANLCQTCIDDQSLGKVLQQGAPVYLANSIEGYLQLLGESWKASQSGAYAVPLVTHSPLENRQTATFEQLAKRSKGKSYLAYLRIDADRVGNAFRSLDSDPAKTRALSAILDQAFSSEVSVLISTKFPNIYPVYGGGDDLFVIGPWNDILDFVLSWRTEFRGICGDQLTFSAGVVLSKPRQHILSKSEEAEHALNVNAKRCRDSIYALGTTLTWNEFEIALQGAKELARFHADGAIKSAMLQNVIELHARWKTGDNRWHSLLFYQVQRNMSGQAKDFVFNAFLRPGNLWKFADFAVRYAMLSASAKEGD